MNTPTVQPSKSKVADFLRRLSRGVGSREEDGLLGDFTVGIRVVPISFLAVAIGVACAYVALLLLRLIGLSGGVRRISDPRRWEPDYGRPAEAQVQWERTHGRPLPNPASVSG